MFPLLVAVLLAAPRSSRSQDPSALLRHRPGPTASWPAQQAEWDPGPEPADRREDDAVDRAWTATPVDSAAEPGGREAGRPLDETADRDSGTKTSEDDDVGEKGEGQAVQDDDDDDDDDDDGQQPGEQRALDIPLTAGDSEATASEMLPVPAPLSMGGRGPPMTLSLEDMDYLTILRPPQPPRRAGGAKHNKRKSNNNGNKNTKAGVKHATKTKPGGGKGRPKTPPQPPAASMSYGPPPPPPAAPPPDSYAGFLGYDAPPPSYGYGFGPYPRYPDPVMTLEYQQATSYPEEERFRPLPPLKGPAAMAPTPLTSPAAPAPVAGTSPSLLSASPLAPTGAPTTGFDPYMAYHHRDYTAASVGTGASAPQDQKTAGAVQVSQSVSAGEHYHSTHGGWPSAPGAPSSSSPATSGSASAAAALGSGLAPADATAAARKATLKDILAQDCPGAEELGYCDSPPRYPMQQVSEAIERCSQLLDHMYAPPPEDREAEGDTEGEGACQSVRRSLRPGYVRDVSSGRWLVALQARGRVVQKVSVERCSAPGRACARLADSKCARNLGFRNGARATACDQRTALVPVLTWDPEAPAACPRLKMARFPVACVCRMLQ